MGIRKVKCRNGKCWVHGKTQYGGGLASESKHYLIPLTKTTSKKSINKKTKSKKYKQKGSGSVSASKKKGSKGTTRKSNSKKCSKKK